MSEVEQTVDFLHLATEKEHISENDDIDEDPEDNDIEEDDDEKWFPEEENKVLPDSGEDEDDDASINEDLFFSDDSDSQLSHMNNKDKFFSIEKTIQLSAEVAQEVHQIGTAQQRVEECDRGVSDTRNEIIQSKARQQNLAQDIHVAEEELRASEGNVTSVKRLLNVIERLQVELNSEKELENSLQAYVKKQELELNHALHARSMYQESEEQLRQKRELLDRIKADQVISRRKREKTCLVNAERKAIKKELEESLKNIEDEQRTKAAIKAAKRAQSDNATFLKETWKRVRERKRAEEESKKKEVDKRVKMLLEYKDNLHRTQVALRKQSKRRARQNQEKEVELAKMNPDEQVLHQRKQKQDLQQKKFTQTQKEAREKIVKTILTEEEEIEKRKKNQPYLFEDRLKGRLNTASTPSYDYLLHPAIKAIEVPKKDDNEVRVSLTSSDEEVADNNDNVVVKPHMAEGQEVTEDTTSLMEPEFRGLWESDTVVKAKKVSHYSVLEQRKMQEALERQRALIIHKQVTNGREFTGQAFMPKPEIVLFSDYDAGEVYSQNVTLTNVSYTINNLKFVAISENLLDFVTVDFIPPGHMSAGLVCNMRVTFEPLIEKDITGEIKMLALTGPFSIPVHCRVKRSVISMPKVFHDFGTVCVGEHHKLNIPITNEGALGTHYTVYEKARYDEMLLNAKTSSAYLIPHIESEDAEALPSTQSLPIPPEAVNDDGVELKVSSIIPTESLVQTKSLDLSQAGEILVSPETWAGFVPEFATKNLEIHYLPRVVAKHTCQYVVVFEDDRIEPVTITFSANTIDLPVYVEHSEVYIKYCMIGRLYQDSVIIYNRATTALRIRFELPKSLRQHFDMLPQIGVVQANSSFSAQFKFIPLESIFEDCAKYFEEEQLLRIPIKIIVADQTRPVCFDIKAHVTNTNVTFSTSELDFGSCSIYESVRMPFEITNDCLLPQMYGFVSLPEFVTIQPNDGFGTLLPGETLKLEAVVHAKILGEHRFNIVCTTEIDRHFSLKCVARGVIPHLEVSHPLIRFAPTALGDVRPASFILSNNSNKSPTGDPVPGEAKSFHIVIPEGAHLTASPSVGTIQPGQKLRVQLSFGPTLNMADIEAEAENIAKEKIIAEIERKKQEALLFEKQAEAVGATNKKSKSRRAASKATTPKSPLEDKETNVTPNFDNLEITTEDKLAAMVKLKANFENHFQKVLIPCFTAPGECSPEKSLDWEHSDIVYLQVHLPTMRPEMILLSQNGKSVINFGNVPVGEGKKLELTLKSITDDVINLSCSIFPHDGSFQKINATRSIEPHSLQQMLLEFAPKYTAKYYEVVEIKSKKSALFLHLHGEGVLPALRLEPSTELNMGYVMVGEALYKTFNLVNESDLDLDFKINLLSQHTEIVQSITFDCEIGNSNESGILPFQCQPHVGVVPKGGSKEIKVKFTPDHSGLFKDTILVTLINQYSTQPLESRLPVVASASTGSLYIVSKNLPEPTVKLHTVVPHTEHHQSEEAISYCGSLHLVFLCSVESPSRVYTQKFSIGNCRGLGIKSDAGVGKDKGGKLAGDFVIDPLKAEVGPLAKAFSFSPQKASVDVTTPQEVVVTLTLPGELAIPNTSHAITTALTLKGETVEVYQLSLNVRIVK